MPQTMTTGSLAEEGWERVVPTDTLQSDIEALFFDICNYLLVLVKDDTRFDSTPQRLLREAIINRDAITAERHLQQVMLENQRQGSQAARPGL